MDSDVFRAAPRDRLRGRRLVVVSNRAALYDVARTRQARGFPGN